MPPLTSSSANTTTTTSRAPPPFRQYKSIVTLPIDLERAKSQYYIDNTLSGSAPLRPNASAPTTGAAIRSIAWSPLGSHIATADARILRVWNPERYNVKFSIELRAAPTPAPPGSRHPPPAGHLTGTERVAWNPTREAELCSVGADGTVRFWDVRQSSRGSCVGEIKVGGDGLSLAWAPDGSEVVVVRKDDVLCAVSRAGMSVRATHAQDVRTDDVAFSNSGRELLVATGAGEVRILDVDGMTPLHALAAHTSACQCVVQSPTGRYIASGGADAVVALFDTQSFICQRTIADVDGPVKSLSWSFDGSFLVAGSDEADMPYSLSVFYIETGETVARVPLACPAGQVAWHPSRYLIAYAGAGGLAVHGAAGGVL